MFIIILIVFNMIIDICQIFVEFVVVFVIQVLRWSKLRIYFTIEKV